MADAQGSGLHETLHGELGAPLFTAPGREWIANGWNLCASFPALPLYSRLAGALGWARAAAVGTSPRRHLENVDPDQGSTATKTRWEYDSTKNTAPSRSPIAHKGNASGYL